LLLATWTESIDSGDKTNFVQLGNLSLFDVSIHDLFASRLLNVTKSLQFLRYLPNKTFAQAHMVGFRGEDINLYKHDMMAIHRKSMGRNSFCAKTSSTFDIRLPICFISLCFV